jgi:prepilin-type N-terminal cleavage/methylation domain-containing protein
MKGILMRRREIHRRAGFTLVELLVVIAIIGALAGLLLPSISRARGQAKRVQCLSTIKQTAQLAMMYSNEKNGWYPIAKGVKNPPAYTSLQVLIDWDKSMKPAQFVCPESRDEFAIEEPGEEGKFTIDEESCSYAWVKKKTNNTDKGSWALISDDSIRNDDEGIEENHQGGLNVAFLDMSAKWFAVEDAGNLLDEATGIPRRLIGNLGGGD